MSNAYFLRYACKTAEGELYEVIEAKTLRALTRPALREQAETWLAITKQPEEFRPAFLVTDADAAMLAEEYREAYKVGGLLVYENDTDFEVVWMKAQ